jgi:hypothetical protein
VAPVSNPDVRRDGTGVGPVKPGFLGCEPNIAEVAIFRTPYLAILPILPTAAPAAMQDPAERL